MNFRHGDKQMRFRTSRTLKDTDSDADDNEDEQNQKKKDQKTAAERKRKAIAQEMKRAEMELSSVMSGVRGFPPKKYRTSINAQEQFYILHQLPPRDTY